MTIIVETDLSTSKYIPYNFYMVN